MLIPRFGSMNNVRNRKNLVSEWMRSKGFRRSGLDSEKLSGDLLSGAANGGEFIRIVMNQIAQAQDVPRWAVYDPDNVLFMRTIKAEIPEALFIHIVRDGRDIALSLKKMGEFRPFPWNRTPGSLEATALYWKWMVETGRENGKAIPGDYLELSFEELVGEPRQALRTLSTFLDQVLDYEKIQNARLGRVREPNSSFGLEAKQSPVNRWKESLSPFQVVQIETLVGDCLEKSGYALTTTPEQRAPAFRHRILKSFYPAFLNLKQWMKTNTPAGRLTNLSALELSDSSTEKIADS